MWGAHGAGRSRVIRDAVFALQFTCASENTLIPSYRQARELPDEIEQAACVLHVVDGDAVSLSEVHALSRASELAGCKLWIVLERTQRLLALSIEIAALDDAALARCCARAWACRS